MKKILLFLLALPLIVISQDKNGCPSESQNNYKCGKITESILPDYENLEFEFSTKLVLELDHNLKRKKDIQKAQKVIELINKVLNDQDFWKALENYKNYKFTKWSNELNDTWEPINKKEITNSFLNGNPTNNSRPNLKEETIFFKLYGNSFKWPYFETAIAKVEGKYVCNKKWFFRKDSIKNIASNWVHEFSHLKGIRHCFACNHERDYSIPYVINRIFIEVANKYE